MTGFDVDEPPLTDTKTMPDIVEGDDVELELVFTDEDGNAIDISSWEVWITVKEIYTDSDSDALIQQATTTHDDPAGGTTTITLQSSDTSGLSGTKVWDCQVKTGSGTIRTVVRGDVKFVPEITEAT